MGKKSKGRRKLAQVQTVEENSTVEGEEPTIVEETPTVVDEILEVEATLAKTEVSTEGTKLPPTLLGRIKKSLLKYQEAGISEDAYRAILRAEAQSQGVSPENLMAQMAVLGTGVSKALKPEREKILGEVTELAAGFLLTVQETADEAVASALKNLQSRVLPWQDAYKKSDGERKCPGFIVSLAFTDAGVGLREVSRIPVTRQ